MTLLQAIILGLVQGLTEFIPVSSSGHLLLLHHVFGIQEVGLGYDVALHIGTFTALLLFFHKDVRDLVRSLILGKGPKAKLAKIVALGTVPAVIAGMLLQTTAETVFRSPQLVCISLVVMAVIMLVAERYASSRNGAKAVERVTFRQGLLVGLAQAIALVPGVSRSGSTITAGLFAGLDRVTATRFSFLLSLPITFGAILKFMYDGDTVQQVREDPALFVVGIVTAFLSGVVAIRFLLRFVAKHPLNIFAYYRLALAAIAIVLLTAF